MKKAKFSIFQNHLLGPHGSTFFNVVGECSAACSHIVSPERAKRFVKLFKAISSRAAEADVGDVHNLQQVAIVTATPKPKFAGAYTFGLELKIYSSGSAYQYTLTRAGKKARWGFLNHQVPITELLAILERLYDDSEDLDWGEEPAKPQTAASSSAEGCCGQVPDHAASISVLTLPKPTPAEAVYNYASKAFAGLDSALKLKLESAKKAEEYLQVFKSAGQPSPQHLAETLLAQGELLWAMTCTFYCKMYLVRHMSSIYMVVLPARVTGTPVADLQVYFLPLTKKAKLQRLCTQAFNKVIGRP